jgi:hypothetical protein
MNKFLFPYLEFWSLGLLAFAAEWFFPHRRVAYRSVLLRDLVALGVYSLSFALVVRFTDRVPIPNYAPASLAEIPIVFKLLLFYIVEDFGPIGPIA